MNRKRLDRQIRFLLEIDKLKNILRRSYLLDASRHENSAEHSWHVATMAVLLAEYAGEAIDLERVLKMLLLHDLVEIDAGDTYCYDATANDDKAERERDAAQRIFGLLPDDQAAGLRELWEEFETRASAEAKFAANLDRLMPLLHNYYTQGRSWKEHGVTRQQVIDRNIHVRDGSETLWTFAESIIEDAVRKGYLAP